MKENKGKNLLIYFLVLFLIVYSGNPLFVCVERYMRLGYIGGSVFMLLLCIMGGRFSIIGKFFGYVLPICFLFLIHLVSIPKTSMVTIIQMLLKWFIGISIICYTKERFIDTYVNIIYYLAIISLAFFAYNSFFGYLPAIPYLSDYDASYHTSLIVYTQLTNEIYRNPGMFWEPGAYQVFLNLALLFLAYREKNKDDLIKIVIIVITVITTFSTTGYIALFFPLYLIIRKYTTKSVFSRAFMIAVLLFVAYYSFSSLDFLGDKLIDNISDTQSSQGRVTDYIIYGNLLSQNPLTGMSLSHGVRTGNGFFFQLLSLGLLGVIYIYSTLYISVRRQNAFIYTMFYWLCLVICFQGEVITVYPLFMALPFIIFPKTYMNSSVKSVN